MNVLRACLLIHHPGSLLVFLRLRRRQGKLASRWNSVGTREVSITINYPLPAIEHCCHSNGKPKDCFLPCTTTGFVFKGREQTWRSLTGHSVIAKWRRWKDTKDTLVPIICLEVCTYMLLPTGLLIWLSGDNKWGFMSRFYLHKPATV